MLPRIKERRRLELLGAASTASTALALVHIVLRLWLTSTLPTVFRGHSLATGPGRSICLSGKGFHIIDQVGLTETVEGEIRVELKSW